MSEPASQMLTPGPPPNSELFAEVERDLARVEQSLVELADEKADPEVAVAWLENRPGVDSSAGCG